MYIRILVAYGWLSFRIHNFQEILVFQQQDNKVNMLQWIYDGKISVYKSEFLPYT